MQQEDDLRGLAKTMEQRRFLVYFFFLNRLNKQRISLQFSENGICRVLVVVLFPTDNHKRNILFFGLNFYLPKRDRRKVFVFQKPAANHRKRGRLHRFLTKHKLPVKRFLIGHKCFGSNNA